MTDVRIEEYEKAYQYALSLAITLHEIHFSENQDWRPLGDLVGLLTQIDNMVSGFVRGVLIEADPVAHSDNSQKEALEDVASHYEAWREGLQIAQREMRREDHGYWQHEINALDRVAAALSTPTEGGAA